MDLQSPAVSVLAFCSLRSVLFFPGTFFSKGQVIDRMESCTGDVSVDLGGGQRRMSQQFLHTADIRPVVQQMGGKGMAQHVGMHLHAQSDFIGMLLHVLLHASGAQRPAKAVDKEQVLSVILPLPGNDFSAQTGGKRHHALLASLTGDPQSPLGKVEVIQSEAQGFRQAQTAGIHDGKENPVSVLERIGQIIGIEKIPDFLGKEDFGHFLFLPHSANGLNGVFLQSAFGLHPAVEGAQNRDLAADGGILEQTAVFSLADGRQKIQKIQPGYFFKGRNVPAGAEVLKFMKIPPIGIHGVGAAGIGQIDVLEKSIHLLIHRGHEQALWRVPALFQPSFPCVPSFCIFPSTP